MIILTYNTDDVKLNFKIVKKNCQKAANKAAQICSLLFGKIMYKIQNISIKILTFWHNWDKILLKLSKTRKAA